MEAERLLIQGLVTKLIDQSRGITFKMATSEEVEDQAVTFESLVRVFLAS